MGELSREQMNMKTKRIKKARPVRTLKGAYELKTAHRALMFLLQNEAKAESK